MKTTKKILAALLVVMMLAMMIPFSASAATTIPAGPYTATLKVSSDNDGYSISVYKIADVDTTTGAYTYASWLTDDIKSTLGAKVNDNGVNSATLLSQCEAVDVKNVATEATHTFDSDTDATKNEYTFSTATAGIFYVKVSGTPDGVSVKKSGGAILSLPYYVKNTNSWETSQNNVTLKVEDGSVTVGKKIVGGDISDSETTANIGDTITFELTASVTGSKEQPLTEYTIHDKMSVGLDTPAVTSVKVDDKTLTENTDYTVNATDLTDIKISLTEGYLNAAKAEEDNGFYSASNVVVTLTAKLNSNAVIGKNTIDSVNNTDNNNKNSDSLTYTNSYGQQNVPGDTVRVYTFDLKVVKVDANNTETKLAGATFTLYDADGNEKAVVADTDNDGLVTFTGLKAGTYTVKETVAPAGYNINSSDFVVTISTSGVITYGNDTITKLTVADTPIVLPQTGGMGTMVFTIVGASLIVCAGVLFIVARKKKSAK